MDVTMLTAEDCKNILLGVAMDNQAKELKKKFDFFRVINPKKAYGGEWCKYLHYRHDDEWGYYRVICDMFVMVVERQLTENDVINCTQMPAFGDAILKNVNNGGYSVDKKGNGKATADVGKIPDFHKPFATDKGIEITLDLGGAKKSKSGGLYQIPAYPVGGGELRYLYMPDGGFKTINYLRTKLMTTKCRFDFERPGGVYFEKGNYQAIVMPANLANYKDEMKEFEND